MTRDAAAGGVWSESPPDTTSTGGALLTCRRE